MNFFPALILIVLVVVPPLGMTVAAQNQRPPAERSPITFCVFVVLLMVFSTQWLRLYWLLFGE